MIRYTEIYEAECACGEKFVFNSSIEKKEISRGRFRELLRINGWLVDWTEEDVMCSKCVIEHNQWHSASQKHKGLNK